MTKTISHKLQMVSVAFSLIRDLDDAKGRKEIIANVAPVLEELENDLNALRQALEAAVKVIR